LKIIRAETQGRRERELFSDLALPYNGQGYKMLRTMNGANRSGSAGNEAEVDDLVGFDGEGELV
jgi:hypothetical protein